MILEKHHELLFNNLVYAAACFSFGAFASLDTSSSLSSVAAACAFGRAAAAAPPASSPNTLAISWFSLRHKGRRGEEEVLMPH